MQSTLFKLPTEQLPPRRGRYVAFDALSAADRAVVRHAYPGKYRGYVYPVDKEGRLARGQRKPQ